MPITATARFEFSFGNMFTARSSISRAASTEHGQEFPPEAMEELIRALGRVPEQRSTLYRPVTAERRAASLNAAALAPVVLTPPRKLVAAE